MPKALTFCPELSTRWTLRYEQFITTQFAFIGSHCPRSTLTMAIICHTISQFPHSSKCWFCKLAQKYLEQNKTKVYLTFGISQRSLLGPSWALLSNKGKSLSRNSCDHSQKSTSNIGNEAWEKGSNRTWALLRRHSRTRHCVTLAASRRSHTIHCDVINHETIRSGNSRFCDRLWTIGPGDRFLKVTRQEIREQSLANRKKKQCKSARLGQLIINCNYWLTR